jgi:hypothetical protein
MPVEDERAYQVGQCKIAAELYTASMSPPVMAEDWKKATAAARLAVSRLLIQSRHLTRIEAALQVNGGHVLVLRQMLAPPLSQDQFAIACPAYSKGAENARRALDAAQSLIVTNTFMAWRDRRLTPWLSEGRRPRPHEIRRLIYAITPLLAGQLHLTAKRTSSSTIQEEAVIALLESKTWERLPSRTIDQRANLSARQFMKKTRFATTTRPQEVDIACGLGGTMVLAMECKVSNDVTNSVKRINDVLKKASAWREHWGSFVQPAAMLQGMIAFKDVERLIHAGVNVFWSHDLGRFERWIDEHANA